MGKSKDWIKGGLAAISPMGALSLLGGGKLANEGMDLLGLGQPEIPSAVPGETPAALPQTPTVADSSVSAAAEEERRRRRAANGISSTLLTGGQGALGAVSTGKKTLLGG